MSMRSLDLYAAESQVGTLFDEQPLRFCYAQSWIDDGGLSLAPGLPAEVPMHAGTAVESFFENLLPEGRLREFLEQQRHATTLFGLLDAVGGDTASGFSLQPSGVRPEAARYRQITWDELARSLADGEPTLSSFEGTDARLSLAGAQNKRLLMVKEGIPYLPEGSSPSSHILKPDIRTFDSVWASALNETFCQLLAKELGLGAAEAAYQPETQACLVTRYDRVWDGSRDELRRLHQLDFCQLAGVRSTVKYESDGGPGLAGCRELLKRADAPLADHQRFIRWIFFNLLIGNHDSHAKNLSVLFTAEGPRLAPFYDLMSTNLYSGLARRFAFSLGGENRPGQIGRQQLDACAGELQLQPRYFRQQGLTLADAMPDAVERVSNRLALIARQGTEQTLIERLGRHITSQARRSKTRWAS
ncbi:phosphatidylinositol kinase [Salinicola sp. MH3R3-1]|uniref:type II toxin-antitoxin system HipA family toxin n=1 Tax=Salinicola sp. MH3R3-1 TaxID=1928762 RepID=UPI00094F3246|nr:type II toxin-antitoxin system HipA family toxin [Salinicola sp. MH3R3-1]OLO07763.1 phosphatidylinositol kinase [Salinicola sp. MH3R3-1]